LLWTLDEALCGSVRCSGLKFRDVQEQMMSTTSRYLTSERAGAYSSDVLHGHTKLDDWCVLHTIPEQGFDANKFEFLLKAFSLEYITHVQRMTVNNRDRLETSISFQGKAVSGNLQWWIVCSL